MAEGTRLVQLVEVISTLKGETTHMQGEQETHKQMLDAGLQQLNNLAASYDQLVVLVGNQNARERPLNRQASNKPLFEGGIHARSIRIEFTKFDGTELMEWVLKAEQLFACFNTIKDQKKN